jgi:hypothetical protein
MELRTAIRRGIRLEEGHLACPESCDARPIHVEECQLVAELK